jgi:pyruvate carboxylase
MAKKVDYLSLGTFEFLVHQSNPEFYFLEVNPRLQVEHTITENICGGVDLVASQLAISQGAKLSDLISHIPTDPASPPKLHSIQLRVTAEDAAANWSLSVGRVSSFSLPTGNGIRNETNLVTGLVVKTDFDSLLAKVIAIAPSWPAVVAKAVRALQDTRIDGVKTSLPALRGIIASPDFLDNRCDTRWLESQLDSILSVGQRLTAELPAPVSAPTGSYGSAVAAASSNVLFRKGDAWSIDLLPAGAKPGTTAPAPAHLAITKVLRNEFPQSLSAEVAYTAPGAQAVNYTASIRSTTASASSLASGAKHRRGEANNPGHVIIPFPGQLVEILVDVGDVIKKGDVVAVVKQMKMELEIRASRGGTVTWVSEELEEGMDVGEGVLVAEVDVREEAKL